MHDPIIADNICKYADTAFASARAKIDDEFGRKLADLREQLGIRGLTRSSVMDRATARLYAERLQALVKARVGHLIESYELYGVPIDDKVAQIILDEAQHLHESGVKAASSAAKEEARNVSGRTGIPLAPEEARAAEFARDLDRLSTPVLNEVACEIERKRVASLSDKRNRASSTAPVSEHLSFDFAWRLMPPKNGAFINEVIPAEAVEEFFSFADATAPEANREEVLWVFKSSFGRALTLSLIRSSSLDWARIDLRHFMNEAATKPPLFIEAFYRACVELTEQHGADKVPDVALINRLLDKHTVGYVLDPPNLRLKEDVETVPLKPTSLLEKAHEEFLRAAERSDELLKEGRGREAVQEIVWLIESITTSFRGLTVDGKTITGSYFNEIIPELKAASIGIRKVTLDWLLRFHGYLSAPGGGGVRHGRELHLQSLEPHEAQLFCNLARIYITYLLAEFERLQR